MCIVHVGSCVLAEVKELAAHAEQIGADAVATGVSALYVRICVRAMVLG